MTEQEYKRQLNIIHRKNIYLKRKNELREERKKYKRKIKLPSTSKLLLLGAVFICFEIIIFAEYVMLKFGDISSLYTLIGVPATLIPVILGYFYKAKAENTVGGIVYDATMKNNEQQNDEQPPNENAAG